MVNHLARKYNLSVKETQGGHTIMGKKLRVEASSVHIEAQDVTNRNPDRAFEEAEGGYTRSAEIANIGQAAIAFLAEYLVDIELPSSPFYRLGTIRGLENAKKAFTELSGVITISAEIQALTNQKVIFEFPIPLYRGELQKPSIVRYNNKSYVFSQDFVDQLFQSLAVVKPTLINPLSPNRTPQHVEVIEQKMFAAPNDPSGWNMLITERY